jgi:hypothetical protein
MKEIMLKKKNPLTGDWLCWIPKTSIAYYLRGEKTSQKFCNEINKGFEEGKIKIDDSGRLVKVD